MRRKRTTCQASADISCCGDCYGMELHCDIRTELQGEPPAPHSGPHKTRDMDPYGRTLIITWEYERGQP